MNQKTIEDVLAIFRAFEISECNQNYQIAVFDAIMATGKNIEDFTIGEMLKLLHNATKAY